MIFAAALLVCKWLRQAIACVTGQNPPYIIGVAMYRLAAARTPPKMGIEKYP